MNPIDSLLVDGVPVEPRLFSVPGMSLSSARANMTAHAFALKANAAASVRALEPAYIRWVAESKLDDEACGGPQDELAAAGYPELSRVIEDASLARLVLGGYLLQEFLGAFTGNGRSQIEYWLDTVESCQLTDGVVHVFGRCYGS